MNKRLRQLNHFVRALITIAEINREGGGGAAWEPLPDKTNPLLSGGNPLQTEQPALDISKAFPASREEKKKVFMEVRQVVS